MNVMNAAPAIKVSQFLPRRKKKNSRKANAMPTGRTTRPIHPEYLESNIPPMPMETIRKPV
ncbi:MAG: hypothetical protein JXI33_07375 [Candidatus Aminicenantes bacterium]|nr:hypothetical protein [Candidatus Aminicenantes bacterium]